MTIASDNKTKPKESLFKLKWKYKVSGSKKEIQGLIQTKDI